MSVCSVSHSVARCERIERNILEHQSVFVQSVFIENIIIQSVFLESVIIQSVFLESVSFQNARAMLCIQRARARG